MQNAIEIRNLSFHYANSSHLIFSNFSWKVGVGEFWVIIGANGSGKSTLVRLLLGLEKATKGSIHILEHHLQKCSQKIFFKQPMSNSIGYVPQHLHFDPRLPITVLDVVEGGTLAPSFWKGLAGPFAKQRTENCLKALEQVGMASYAKERFSQLSGGQKQRILIARALVTESPLLILDEPTASVDPAAAKEIVQICQQLRKKHTILFISHDISMIPDVCEYIICISTVASQESNEKTNIAHSHDVRGLSREEILLLLYSHWGLNTKPTDLV